MHIGRLSPDFAELQSTGAMSGRAARLPGSKDDEGSSGYLPDWPEHTAQRIALKLRRAAKRFIP